MSQYVSVVWKCRYFWMSLVQLDLRMRYRRSILGLGWSLLQPIAMTAVLCVVFSSVFNENPATYAPKLLVGLCFWSFIATSTLQGSDCLFKGEKYIRQYPAPMAIYPLRTVLGGAFHLAMALLVVVALRFTFRFHEPWGLASFVSLIPTFAMLLVLGWSLAVLAGFSTAYFPDVQHLAEVALQMLFYATPIIYAPEQLRNRGLGWLVDCNPLAAFVQALRDPLLLGQFPPLEVVATMGLSTTAFAGAAVLTLSRLERRVIFQL
jgi:ABC-type polysaccharide/polyol phosphate export permease